MSEWGGRRTEGDDGTCISRPVHASPENQSISLEFSNTKVVEFCRTIHMSSVFLMNTNARWI